MTTFFEGDKDYDNRKPANIRKSRLRGALRIWQRAQAGKVKNAGKRKRKDFPYAKELGLEVPGHTVTGRSGESRGPGESKEG